jgi:hypothetical protein
MHFGRVVKRLWNFLSANAAALGAISSIATALALIATVFALFLARASLRDTERAVEANLMYQLQSDAREISSEIFSPSEVRDYILARPSPDFSPGVGAPGS